MLRNEKFGEDSSEVPKFCSLNYTKRKIIFGVAYFRTLQVEVLPVWRENVDTKTEWLWYHKHLKISVLNTSKKVFMCNTGPKNTPDFKRTREDD